MIRWRNAGTLSAYMIRERSGRYWIVPTCGRRPHPRCRLRHGILESYLLPYEPRQIVAIDIAGQMIEKARMKYPDHPLIEFLQEDAMSYEGKGFDYIILYSAYPHFMRPERLIEHMSGLLAPGGKLVICHSESKERSIRTTIGTPIDYRCPCPRPERWRH